MGLGEPSTYNTDAEITFINQIGTYTFVGGRMPRLEILEKYHEAMLRRRRWAGIDKPKVMAHLGNALVAEQVRAKGIMAGI